MTRRIMVGLLAALGLAATAQAAAPAPAPASAELKLWRLDCGEIRFEDLNFFSDTFAFAGQSGTVVGSCYLIGHGDKYLLWDAGLSAALVGKTTETPGRRTSLKEALGPQLQRIGVKPEDIDFVGISHLHADHVGQAATFPKATLLIGKRDFEILSAPSADGSPRAIEPWISGGGTKELLSGDKDVFGDGRVVVLATPGHTPDHHSLLVRLRDKGPVLLTGDLYHMTENVALRGMPATNFNRAETLASFDRFQGIAKNLKATVIIQHEPDDVGKLPAFPAAAQ